jgi:hypothetical protein
LSDHRATVRPNGPTVPPTARATRGIVGPLGRNMSLGPFPARWAGLGERLALWAGSAFARGPLQTVGPVGRLSVALYKSSGRKAGGCCGAWFSGPERAIVRPNGPAIPPARVVGPGGVSHHHPVRPNGPTVPPTARATRGIVGPLGRHMSLGPFPARWAGLGEWLALWAVCAWPFTNRWGRMAAGWCGPARSRLVLCPWERGASDECPAGGHGGPRSRDVGLVWPVPLVVRKVGPLIRTRSKFELDRLGSFAASRAWGVFRSMRLLSPPPVPSRPVRRHEVAASLGAHEVALRMATGYPLR